MYDEASEAAALAGDEAGSAAPPSHPLAFVAKGTHGTYRAGGNHFYGLVGVDECAPLGEAPLALPWETWRSLELVLPAE